MENFDDIICQWNHCDEFASKHVRFGFWIFDSADGPCGNAVTTMPDHYDLCESHVTESGSYYHNVAVDDLDDCPVNCRKLA